MGNDPTPAVAGLNWPPLTPVPLYVPPAGDPPVSVNAASVEHTAVNADKVTVGNGFTVTTVAAEGAEEHPFAFLTVTVKVPLALTMIDCVVAPLLHKYEVAALEVSVTLPPWQNVVAPPPVEMVGVAGNGLTVTTVGAEVRLVHPFAVTATV